MRWLKADLHLHSNDDPKEKHLCYDSIELIDHMADNGFDVISITLHDTFGYNKKLAGHAKKKGILLIPGIEKKIEGKEVLVYNVYPEELNKIKKLSDLKKIRRKDTLIVAPHPYYILSQCLKANLEKYIDSFDAIEHCMLYWGPFGRNKKAKNTAKRYSKPLLANSDGHQLALIGTNYTMIRSQKNIISIFDAIKTSKIMIKTRPLKACEAIMLVYSLTLSIAKRLISLDRVFRRNNR